MRHLGALLLLVLTTWCLTGCSQGLETRDFQSRAIETASPDDVFQVAQVLLRREFGRLQVEAGAHRIVSEPVEYRTSSESGTARDFYGGRSTMRRTAHFSVSPRSGGAVARLRIEIERQDTDRREVFQPDRNRISDAPSQTPIERDAATSTEQNTVWTFVRRDRQLERALLAELQERFAPPQEAESAQPTDDRQTGTP